MRFSAVLSVRKIAELTLRHSNLPESYVRQCTEVIEYSAPKLPSHRQITVKRIRKHYDLHRPWTEEFQMLNEFDKHLAKVWVEPVKEWSYFKGDRVEVLSGKDKGKQGFVTYIVQERNWVLVGGLNMRYMDSKSKVIPKKLREVPLVIERQVALVDPMDLRPTKIEWKYDENGNRVRVSMRTGRILPIPILESETYDYKMKEAYKAGDKDTVNEELSKVTFVPKVATFEMDIMEEYGIYEERIPAKTYWY